MGEGVAAPKATVIEPAPAWDSPPAAEVEPVSSGSSVEEVAAPPRAPQEGGGGGSRAGTPPATGARPTPAAGDANADASAMVLAANWPTACPEAPREEGAGAGDGARGRWLEAGAVVAGPRTREETAAAALCQQLRERGERLEAVVREELAQGRRLEDAAVVSFSSWFPDPLSFVHVP